MPTTARRFAAWVAVAGRPKAHVAQDIGISPSMLSHILAGRKRPGLDTAAAIERLTARAPGGPIRATGWSRPERRAA